MENIIYLIPIDITDINQIVCIKEKHINPKFDIRFESGYNKLLKLLKKKEYPLGYSFLFYKIYLQDSDENEYMIDGGTCRIYKNDNNYELLLFRQPPTKDTQEEIANYIRKTGKIIKESIKQLNSLDITETDKKKFISIRKEIADMYYSCIPTTLTVYDKCLIHDDSMFTEEYNHG